MKIPYGISNFKSLREQGYLYADKTMYIESLENKKDLKQALLIFIGKDKYEIVEK